MNEFKHNMDQFKMLHPTRYVEQKGVVLSGSTRSLPIENENRKQFERYQNEKALQERRVFIQPLPNSSEYNQNTKLGANAYPSIEGFNTNKGYPSKSSIPDKVFSQRIHTNVKSNWLPVTSRQNNIPTDRQQRDTRSEFRENLSLKQ
jgi:cellulase/cellobiase CelA1